MEKKLIYATILRKAEIIKKETFSKEVKDLYNTTNDKLYRQHTI